MRLALASAFGAAALIAIASAGLTRAHEGHDHGPQSTTPQPNANPRGAAASSDFELVAVALGEELVIYLDRFATNEPVLDASIEIETPAGSVTAPFANGAYRLKAPWLAKPGHVDLIATVTAGGTADVLPVSIDIPDRATPSGGPTGVAYLSALTQPATWIAVALGAMAGALLTAVVRRRRPAAAALAIVIIGASSLGTTRAFAQDAPALQIGTDRATRGVDGAVFVPKPIQRIYGVRTLIAEAAVHSRSVELPGRIIPDPNASGYVQASAGGRLSPPPGGFPRLGTRVRQGHVLAYVTAPLQAIDVSDMRQRQGELDQQIAIVERRVTRFERLAPSGAVAQIQLDEAKLELDGLRDRRVWLDRIRREPEPLVAPVDGVIADGSPVAGQVVQPNAVIFHIVEPARLWVEALTFDTVSVRSASAVGPSGAALPLVYRGSGFADRNQSVPIHFAVEGDPKSLRSGQFVTVFAVTDEQREGIAVPGQSVARAANGQDLVYVHASAERFEPRVVRFEPLDGERVVVTAGLEAGERIVVQGAELLDHVR